MSSGGASSRRAAASLAATLLLRGGGGPPCAEALPPSASAALMGWPLRRRRGFFSSSTTSVLTRASLGDLGDASAKASSSCFDDGVGSSELKKKKEKKNSPLLIHSAAIPPTPTTRLSTFSSLTSSSSSFSEQLHDPIAIPAHPCHRDCSTTVAETESSSLLAAAAEESESAKGVAAAPAACPSQQQKQKPAAVHWQDGGVPLEAKECLLHQKACVVWLTGLPASGKSAVAAALERELGKRKRATALLDGDNVRHGLCADLGFSPQDRAENVRRVGEAARLLSCGGGGLIAIAALVSPYAAHRDAVRASLPPGRFVEVFVDSPLALCEERDPKGLYKACREGKLRGLTGLDAPYERPGSPEVTVRPRESAGGAEAAAGEVVKFLEGRGLIPPVAE